MRILRDECVNPRLREACSAHEVSTVATAQWRTLRDSELLDRAAGLFEVFVTIDRGFARQLNLKKFSLAIVLIRVRKNRMEYYRPIFPQLLRAIEEVRAGELLEIWSRIEKMPPALRVAGGISPANALS